MTVARSLSSKALRNCEGLEVLEIFHYGVSEMATVFSVSYHATFPQLTLFRPSLAHRGCVVTIVFQICLETSILFLEGPWMLMSLPIRKTTCCPFKGSSKLTSALLGAVVSTATPESRDTLAANQEFAVTRPQRCVRSRSNWKVET
jgi:hypothetical protein